MIYYNKLVFSQNRVSLNIKKAPHNNDKSFIRTETMSIFDTYLL